jgi:hypothetical protein
LVSESPAIRLARLLVLELVFASLDSWKLLEPEKPMVMLPVREWPMVLPRELKGLAH